MGVWVHFTDWLRRPRPWKDSAPDVVGEISAWRVWLVALDGDHEYALWSCYAAVRWPPGGILQAECRREKDPFRGMGKPHEDPPPAAECRCGIYGLARPDNHDIYSCMLQPTWARHVGHDAVPVLGRVALWGRVRVGTQGWRAEFARVLALVDRPRYREKVRLVAQRYEVPILGEKEVER